MAEPLRFGPEDSGNLELVRQVLFRRLREDRSWAQFDHSGHGFDPYVEIHPSMQDRFQILSNQVMWELIIQGVLTPGLNAANPNLPWFRLTDYGREVLAADKFVPHDPTRYIAEVRSVARSTVKGVAFAYLEEALECFVRGVHVASALLLGVAAEAVFLDLCKVVSRSIRDPNERRHFDRLDSIRQKHNWIVQKYRNLPSDVRRSRLPESLDLTLGSLYDAIRRQRNDLGHPQEQLPKMSRDQAFVLFWIFPTFIGDVETFAAYIRRAKI